MYRIEHGRNAIHRHELDLLPSAEKQGLKIELRPSPVPTFGIVLTTIVSQHFQGKHISHQT